MNTCDTCKWWGDETERGLTDGHKFCMCPKLDSYATNIKSGEWTFLKQDQSYTLAQAGTDAGYPYLTTGPRFGCVHHEPK